jgi:hypothetical protein
MKPSFEQLMLVFIALLMFPACDSQPGQQEVYWENHPMTYHKVACFLFVVPDCPLAMNYTKEFLSLYHEYRDSGVRFTAVIPGNLYTQTEIDDFQKEYSLETPLIVDTDLSITQAFGATVSPECFVFNKQKQLLYHGKMDEWVKELGSKFGGHGRNFAKEAISAGLRDRIPPTRHKEAIGCSIEIDL